MASLLEQYEQATSTRNQTSSRVNSSKTMTAALPPVTSTETSIFTKQRVDFQLPAGKTIYRMTICDKLVILAMKDSTIYRIDLKNSADQIDTLEVKTTSVNDSVDDVFVDPMGRHILLAMRSGECLYFGRNSKKSRSITKLLKTQLLSAVGWLQNSSDKSGPALLGTQQGAVFETEFNVNAAETSGVFLSSSLELYWKQVCNLAQPEPVLIKGICIDRSKKKGNNCVVLVATPTRLYQFKGLLGSNTEASIFTEIFQLDPEKPMTNFIELPGNPRHCCLAAFPATSEEGSVSSFAWLTEPGVYFADISENTSQEASVLVKPQLYAIPKDNKSARPVSLVVTEFHILLQFSTVVLALSKLANNIVSEEVFPDKYGKLMGICRDAVNNVVWAYSESAVYRYRIVDESRNVWKIYLEKGDYDAALRYSHHNAAINNVVKILKADSCLKSGDYEQSAEIYATCDAPFEEVALKFTRLRQEKALKLLLLKKAESLRSLKFAPQLFMITSWLMEIYMNSLGQMRTSGKEEATYNSLLVEFRSFLANPTFLDTFKSSPEVFYSLILSHAAHEDYLFLVTQLNDTRRLVEFHLERSNYQEALRILAVQGSCELVYEFSPKLLKNVPARTVDVWISKGKSLNPHRLLPMLQRSTGSESNVEAQEILRYLQHCVHMLGSLDPAVHNSMVNLFVRTKNEDALIAYLITADEEFSRKNLELYDQKSALRLCMESGLHRAAVHLFCSLNLHLEAVELALEFDTDRAKEIASSSSLDDDLRKRLWLLIAQNVIQQNTSISKATEVLKESGDIIKIEDILPFFPDFVTIDDFKDAICASLEDYNRHISELKNEVEEATKDAESLRSEIQEYRNQCLFINAQDLCCVCKQPLLSQQFFVFPCKHHMHFQCLLSIVKRHLASPKLALVEDLKKQLDTLVDQEDTVSLTSSGSGIGSSSISRREVVKQELENIVAEECPFCGRLMILSVDLPFISADEYEKSLASW